MVTRVLSPSLVDAVKAPGSAQLSSEAAPPPGPVRQNALTAVLPIREGQEHVAHVRAALQAVRDAPGGIEDNPHLPFSALGTLHFGRFVVVEESLAKDGGRRRLERPLLVFASNHDGEAGDHLAELVEHGGDWLHRVLGHCEGYDEPAPRGAAIRDVLLRHRVPYAGLHVGGVGFSVRQIRAEESLRREIQTYLDAHPELRKGHTPEEIREAVRSHVAGTEHRWALEPAARSRVWATLPRGSIGHAAAALGRVGLAVAPLVVLGIALTRGSPFLAAVGAVATLPLLVFLLKEATDPVFPRTRYDERAQELAAREDKIVQNQLSILADIKDGWIRSYVLRTVLALINTVGRLFYRKGRLGSIGTIHFARWVIVEHERALLFFSNYTGSWEQYLGDFVDRASVGLTAVWSNTVLFPRTWGLIGGGARDEERFKTWARAQQMETDLWYSAYRELSMENILNNHAIRVGLGKSLTGKEARAWVRRL